CRKARDLCSESLGQDTRSDGMKTPRLRCFVIALLLASVAMSGSPLAGQLVKVGRKEKPSLPEPDPMSGSIGVTVRTRPPAKIGPGLPAVEIFFVKLEDGEEAFGATDLIPSNYSNKKQVYLLNADPGRYVAVAAGLGSTKGPAVGVPLGGGKVGGVDVSFGMSSGTTIDYSAFFSIAMISETETRVVPQEMAFMGEYLVSTSTKMKKADAAQAHYFRLLLPAEAGKKKFARMFSAHVYTAEIRSVAKDTETERGFWTTARDKVFKNNPRWQARARRQLAALSEQDPN
ncbi:MAG: hypothetical protein ACE5GX_20575, partial [Thermoanaerobaculia bacterium]